MLDDSVTAAAAATLAAEDAGRSRTVTAAVIAALMTLGGAVMSAIAFGSLPSYENRVVTITDALGDLAAGRAVPPGRAVLQLKYIGDHPFGFLAGPLFSAVGGLLIFFVLAYLYRATRARGGQLSQIAFVAAAAGALAYAIGTALVGVMRVVEAKSLAAGATNADALDAIGSAPIVAGTLIQLVGSLTLGFAFVMISLNAMRVGLLTRFVGIIGMIAGATFVLPLDQQGIIRAFWLGAVGFLISGRWPSPVPAWATGRAEPWPSAREARESRGTVPAEAPPAPPTPAPTLPDGLTQGQRRKKRKRS